MAHGHPHEEAEHVQHAAHDPFDRRVAMSMVVIAAILAAVKVLGHRTHNDTLAYQIKANVAHTQASNDFAFFQAKRQRIWRYYQAHLQDWADKHGVRLSVVPEHCEQPYHMFYILLPSLEQRNRLIERLRAAGILAVFHYLPLHLSEMGRKLGGKEGDCPVTEDISDRLLRLPFYNELTEAEQERVVAAVRGE